MLFRYTPDRSGEHPRRHPHDHDAMHVDGYAGFAKLYGQRNSVVACMADVRRRFFAVHALSAPPIAREAMERIGALYGELVRGKTSRRATRRAADESRAGARRPSALAGGGLPQAVAQVGPSGRDSLRPDPKRVLRGESKVNRIIRLPTPETLLEPDVDEMIEQACWLSYVPQPW